MELTIPISKIEPNIGQIQGLPSNPRKLTKNKIDKLVRSIEEDPEMLHLRGLLVYPYQGRYVAIGGNARLKALTRMGMTQVDCVVIPKETPIDKLKHYVIKDNASFGDWDYKAMAEGWALTDLDNWAIDIPNNIATSIALDEEIGSNNTAPSWGENSKGEKRSDLKEAVNYHQYGSFSYLSTFKTTKEGETLTNIKTNRSNVENFASSAEAVIRKLLSVRLTNTWCIITTPKRRHKEENFAEAVCKEISRRTSIKFHADVLQAKNKDRLHPQFTLTQPIQEPNVIVYDDIVTTCSTLSCVNDTLTTKNLVFVVGINNR